MSVSVYKLRIRENAGDDTAWQEARVVAANVEEALVQAQQRFGVDRVLAIELDAAAESPPADDAHAPAVVAAMVEDAHAVPVPAHVAADAVVELADVEAALGEPLLAHHVPAVPAYAAHVPRAEPMPWEGRWRPSVLLWIGVALGLIFFVVWLSVSGVGRERFVTAAPTAPPGEDAPLPMDATAPRGGVLAATGATIVPGLPRSAEGYPLGEAAEEWPEESPEAIAESAMSTDHELDEDVQAIGRLVGEMFAGDDPAAEARAQAPVVPPARSYEYRMPQAATPPPAELRAFFVEVLRPGNVVETLRVTAYDADHARAIVTDLPERPVILRGPSLELRW
jgi:hypothetical protein